MADQRYDFDADFVVVGAGSAGCVMAARLSEDPSIRVVLLEAGGEDRNRWIHIPFGYGKTFADASVNWCYQAEPDPGANGRSIFWPRGKVLGGSSSINGMVYIRGQHEDFDLWRQLGNTGWSSTDVLPYFRRAQHQTRGAERVPRHRRAALRVRHIGAPSDLRSLHQGCHGTRLSAQRRLQRGQAGRRRLPPDDHAQRPTLLHRRRLPASGDDARPNLRVITGALTERIRSTAARQSASTFREFDQSHTVRAAREVILCGGAVNSPQLLLLSGVGPQDQLAQFGVLWCTICRASARACRITTPRAIKLKCRLPITVNDVMQSSVQEAEGRAAVPSLPHRSPHDGGGPCGAVRADTRRTCHAGREDFGGPIQFRPAAGWTASMVGLRARPPTSFAPKAAARSRLKIGKSLRSACHASELFGDRDRSPCLGRWPEDRPPRPRHVGHAALHVPRNISQGRRCRPTNNCWSMRGTPEAPCSTQPARARWAVDPMAVVDPELRVHGIGVCAWSMRQSCRR